jgi:formate-dependent nitrite reductase membrane component NrfD
MSIVLVLYAVGCLISLKGLLKERNKAEMICFFSLLAICTVLIALRILHIQLPSPLEVLSWWVGDVLKLSY